MSAREQARRVADATEAITFCKPCDIADAVSDVWEPIVLDLIAALREPTLDHGIGADHKARVLAQVEGLL